MRASGRPQTRPQAAKGVASNAVLIRRIERMSTSISASMPVARASLPASRW